FILSRPQLVSLSLGVLGLFGAFMLFFALSFSDLVYGHPFVERFFAAIPGGAKIKKIYETFHSYKKNPKYFIYACALTLLTQVAAILFFYLVGTAMGIEEVSIVTYMFAVPLGLIATALPIS